MRKAILIRWLHSNGRPSILTVLSIASAGRHDILDHALTQDSVRVHAFASNQPDERRFNHVRHRFPYSNPLSEMVLAFGVGEDMNLMRKQ